MHALINFSKEEKEKQIKPNLILAEKDFFVGIESRSIGHAQNLQEDLISVLQFLIDNKDTLKIDLDYFEYENKYGIYRNVAGWWAYWLGIPIQYEDATSQFMKIFFNKNFFLCFKQYCEYSSSITMYDSFFGDSTYGTLQERKTKAQYLRYETFS